MRTVFLPLFAIFVMLLNSSCTKEEQQSKGSPVKITIRCEMGEFAPGTKSTAESCIRMKWGAGDVVWAYDQNGSGLGKLTVTVLESDYVAIMNGTLSSVPDNNRLFLVHSPLLDKETQPEYGGGLTVDMSNQSDADVTPFVAYATVEGVTTDVQTDLKTKFGFATSVLNINATGIANGLPLTSASISNIESVCKLTINSSTGTFEVSNDGTTATIAKALGGKIHLSSSSFYIGIPTLNAPASGKSRILTVVAGKKNYYCYDVVSTAHEMNNNVNYVYEVKTLDYIDEYNVSRGDGTYIAATGLVWAPVNCGYEPTNYKYGKLYQWGRKNGCGYTGSSAADCDDAGGVIQSLCDGQIYLKDEDASKFYNKEWDWCEGESSYLWNASIIGSFEDLNYIAIKTDRDPCPNGWRVPTYRELNALIGGKNISWSSLQTYNNQKGHWFDGENAAASDSSGIFLPAAGYRDYSSGSACGRKDYGRYWSSLQSANYCAYYLYLNNSSAGVGSSERRANGYSIRCVQE